MRVVAISDQHGRLPDIPECDILLIAGDICPTVNHSPSFQRSWLDTNFRSWLNNIPARHVVGVAGNHDFLFHERPDQIPELRWKYLKDDGCTIEGISIWGTPWQPWFWDWAFNAPRNEKENENEPFLTEKFSHIPVGTDIVVAHSPAYQVGATDLLIAQHGGNHVGSRALRARMHIVKPKLLVYGHIHNGREFSPVQMSWSDPSSGSVVRNGTVANVSVLDEDYRLRYAPMEFEWERLCKGFDPASEEFQDARDSRYHDI